MIVDDRIHAKDAPHPTRCWQAAQQGARGRLKIFLGAAPASARPTRCSPRHRRASRKASTSSSASSRPTAARKPRHCSTASRSCRAARSNTADARWQEMDLDALLARRPQLALVDELAHTNAPGSRHPKRYMDVEELIAAGIDVYTTLNVQHIESLNDVVARITRIRVRETVPDSIIDKADDIELIDLTPDDLIQRLQDGKVYVPHQAERAIRHYFSPGNLTALRELALRRTAQRVDEQMVRYMQAHAIPGPWAAGERVLACVGGDASSTDVVRHAKRMADSLKAPWTAIHVETGRNLDISDAERDRIAEALRLAQRLGAETVTLPGQDVADTIADYARANNFTHIIIVQPPRSRWLELLLRLAGAAADPQGRRRQRPCARAQPRATDQPEQRACRDAAPRGRRCQGLSRQPRLRRGRTRRRARAAPDAGARQHRADLPDRGAGVRGGLRAVAGAVRLLRQRAGLQFLLPAAALHLHHRRSGERRRAVLLRRHRGDRQQSHRAGARAGDRRRASARARPRNCTSSAASWRARRTSTICCGRPCIRSR